MFCSSSEDLSTAYECSTGCKLVDDLNQVCKDKLDSENAGTSTALLPVFYSVSTCVCVFFFCVCVCVCERACVRSCVRACVRARARMSFSAVSVFKNNNLKQE